VGIKWVSFEVKRDEKRKKILDLIGSRR